MTTIEGNTLLYGDAPTVLIFADSEERRARAGEAVRAMGGRVAAAMAIPGAAERLADQAAVDAVIVDVGGDAGASLEGLFDGISAGAMQRRHGAVVMVSPDLIDLAAARAWHRDVLLLSNPTPAESQAAIGVALAEPRLHLSDVNGDTMIPRLQQLSEEVGRIARTLASLSGDEAVNRRALGLVRSPAESLPDAAQVRSIIRLRRLRDQHFPAEMFADPAWDMLLDLTAARLEGRQVAVSSLCIAAAVPPTTALRWIKQLTDAALFVREADAKDGRRVFITLSDEATDGMAAYLAAAQRLPGLAV